MTTVATAGELVVRLSGEIDLSLRPQLWELIPGLPAHAGRVVVDAGGVTFCDGTLPEFLAEALDRGPVSVRSASALVRDVLKVYGTVDRL